MKIKKKKTIYNNNENKKNEIHKLIIIFTYSWAIFKVIKVISCIGTKNTYPVWTKWETIPLKVATKLHELVTYEYMHQRCKHNKNDTKTGNK